MQYIKSFLAFGYRLSFEVENDGNVALILNNSACNKGLVEPRLRARMIPIIFKEFVNLLIDCYILGIDTKELSVFTDLLEPIDSQELNRFKFYIKYCGFTRTGYEIDGTPEIIIRAFDYESLICSPLFSKHIDFYTTQLLLETIGSE